MSLGPESLLPRNVPPHVQNLKRLTTFLHQNRYEFKQITTVLSYTHTHVPVLYKNEQFSPTLPLDLWLAFYKE